MIFGPRSLASNNFSMSSALLDSDASFKHRLSQLGVSKEVEDALIQGAMIRLENWPLLQVEILQPPKMKMLNPGSKMCWVVRPLVQSCLVFGGCFLRVTPLT